MGIDFSDDVCPTNREPVVHIRMTVAEARRHVEASTGERCERYWLSEDEACKLVNLGIEDYTIHQIRDGRFAMWRTVSAITKLQIENKYVWRRLVERRITDED